MPSEAAALYQLPVSSPDPFEFTSEVDDLLNRAREVMGSPGKPDAHHHLQISTGLSSGLVGMSNRFEGPMRQWVDLTVNMDGMEPGAPAPER